MHCLLTLASKILDSDFLAYKRRGFDSTIERYSRIFLRERSDME